MLEFLGFALWAWFPTAQVLSKQMLQSRPRSFRMSLEHINVVANGGPVKRILGNNILDKIDGSA